MAIEPNTLAAKVTALHVQSQAVRAAPILSRPALAIELVADALNVLGDMAAQLDAIQLERGSRT